MFSKAIALAIAGMVTLTGPALAADAAQASAAKADVLQRASALQGGTTELSGDPDFLIFLAFGLISTAVIVAAFDDDDDAVSA